MQLFPSESEFLRGPTVLEQNSIWNTAGLFQQQFCPKEVKLLLVPRQTKT